MRIDRIEIKGFGTLENRTISLKTGINLVYGSNESGKSTLQWFIKGMLYGLKGGSQPKTGPLQARRRFAPWNGGRYGGALVYSLDNGLNYRVERDFENDTVRLYDGFFNDISSQFEKGRDKQPAFADRQLGMDEAIFERTVLIRQMEVRLDGDGTAILAAKLANVGGSGFDDVSLARAEKALMEAKKNNVGTGRTTTQPLDRLEARLRQLTAVREALNKRQEQRRITRTELLQLGKSYRRLEKKRLYLQKVGELIELRKTLDLYLKQEAGLKDAARQLKELESALPADLRTPSAAVMDQEPDLQKWYRNPVLYIAGTFLCCILLIYSILSGHKGPELLLPLIVAAGALSAGTAAFFELGRRRSQRSLSVKEVSDGEKNPYDIRIKALCSSASVLRGKLLEEPAAVRREWKEVAGTLETLSGRLDSGIEAACAMGRDMEAELDDVDSDNALFGKAMSDGLFLPEELDAVLYDSSPESLDKAWKEESERTDKELLDSALREKYCEGLLRDGQSDDEELQHVEEETVAVREKITYLKSRGEALQLAYDVLKEAGLEIRRTYAPGLDNRMSSIVSGLTGGRYTDLRGDDRLAVKVALPDSGDIRSALQFSGAAADQMYLALRLAMVGLLTEGGESLPLLMDEVFSQFDDNRTANALKYLKNAYEKGQVLIFTCKQREVELAREICGEDLNLVEL